MDVLYRLGEAGAAEVGTLVKGGVILLSACAGARLLRRRLRCVSTGGAPGQGSLGLASVRAPCGCARRRHGIARAGEPQLAIERLVAHRTSEEALDQAIGLFRSRRG